MYWIKYNKHTSSLPANFVAISDARMKVNPVWGQGMAKATVDVTTLDAVLRASTDSAVGPAFFKKAAARTTRVWKGNKIADYGSDACEPALGETRELGARQRRFNAAVGKRALAGDKDIQRRLTGLRAWVYPHTDMLAPSVLAKLAWDWVRGR
jgi:2-polyprenyl-6-methoxyphenol hydroxylase-like FAD-dependent oxidoreductase